MIKIPALNNAGMRSKVYGYFRGCDFTTDPAEIDDSRSPDMLNIIPDYAGFPSKRVGWRVMQAFTGHINGLHYAHFAGCNPAIIVHHGVRLSVYDLVTGQVTLQTSLVHDSRSTSFFHNNYLYLMDGDVFYRLTYSGGSYVRESVYSAAKTPTTGRGGHWEATDDGNGGITYYWVACTPHEEPNILSSHQVNLFAGDGVNNVFWLTEANTTIDKVEIYSGSPVAVWTETTAYTKIEDTYSYHKTKIAFDSPPPMHPDGAGIDNIRITFTSTENPQHADDIAKCTICTAYGYFNDNRIFASGNPDHKNRDWACDVDDPTYWPLNQWTDIGSDHTAIQGYLHYGDALAIIKEDDNQDAEIYMRTASVQSDNSVLYPVQQGAKGVGAISHYGFATLRDDALFYAREGVYAVAGTDASQQRTIQNRSHFVDNRMRAETNKENAVAAVWNNRYLLCFPDSGHCYVADGRMQSAFNESWVYEWYYWDNIPARVFIEFDGKLFFGTEDGRLCRFNDDMLTNAKYSDGLTLLAGANPDDETALVGGTAINAHLVTKADTFGDISRLKTLTNRGCTVMLKATQGASVAIKAKTNSESSIDFGGITGNQNTDTQIVALRKKLKNFHYLQLKLENTGDRQSFSVYRIQVQYTFNNYIK